MKILTIIFLSLTFLFSCGQKKSSVNDYKTGYETGFQSGANRVCKRFKASLADSDYDYHAPKECKQK